MLFNEQIFKSELIPTFYFKDRIEDIKCDNLLVALYLWTVFSNSSINKYKSLRKHIDKTFLLPVVHNSLAKLLLVVPSFVYLE